METTLKRRASVRRHTGARAEDDLVAPDNKPLRLRDQSRIATHQKLLDVGLRLFVSKGVAKTTATKIARQAKVSIGTFYLHFRDKEALLSEAWKAYFGEESQHLRIIFVAEDENRPELIAERVRANAGELVQWVEQHPAEFRFWNSHEVRATPVGQEIDQTWTNWIEARLRRDQALGDELVHDVNPAVATQAILGLCTRTLRWWAEDFSRADREDVINVLVRLHLSLYSAPRGY